MVLTKIYPALRWPGGTMAVGAVWLTMGLGGLAFIAPAPAMAQAAAEAGRRNFNIPAQSLEGAITAFGLQSGLRVSAPQPLLAGRKSSGVHGGLTPVEALSRLLSGTGLAYRWVDGRSLVLEAAPQISGDAVQLGTLRVESGGAVQGAGGQDGRGRNRGNSRQATSPAAGATQFVPYQSDGMAPPVVSSRIAKVERQDPNSLLRSIPGSHSLHSRSQPGLSVNIRGLAGAGRVNMMIDGVTQTFRNQAGHGSGGPFAYVDPALLAGVDVQRGAVGGAQGAGTLGGATNFRTLGVEDLIGEGRLWGARATFRAGDNGYGWGETVAGAVQSAREGEDNRYGIMLAQSNGKSTEYRTARDQSNSYDPTRQKPRSLLVKAILQPNDQHRLDLSGMIYKNEFYHNYPWNLKNRNFRAKYEYTPYNDWIDITANVYANKTNLHYPPVEDSTYIGRKTHNEFFAWDITNVSRFAIGGVDVRWSNGFKYQDDDFIADTPHLRGANPVGRSKMESLFTTLEMKRGIFAATLGGRYDRYHISGHIPTCSDVPGECEEINGGGLDVKRRIESFNPSIDLAVQPASWIQAYVSLSRTSRAPRIQEMFFEKIPLAPDASDADGVGGNPFLRKETSRNLQFGFNIAQTALVFDDDLFNLRVTRFVNKIKGYIKPQYLLVVHEPDVPAYVVPIDNDGTLWDIVDLLDADSFTTLTRWMNHPGKVKMSGLEIEAHYATQRFHATLSWTKSKTSAPTIEYVYLENINTLPDTYWTFDAGARFWHQRAQIGFRAEYSGPTEEPDTFFQTRKSKSTGILLDLYGNVTLMKQASLWFNIENIANKSYNYNASVDSFFSPVIDQGNGRGRTFSAGLTVSF